MCLTFKRDYNAHLGNTTNNRLESCNQKLKDLMSRSSNVTEMLQSLRFTRITAAEYSHSVFQEESTTLTHTVADNSLQGALEIRAVHTQYVRHHGC